MTASTPVRLTSFSHGAGCACKLPPEDLHQLLDLVPALAVVDDDRLLVGLGGSDDAAVYQVRDDLALVFTTDFFTPIVDDAYDWGRVAATNALSDVYAMGGSPLLALNLVAWPREALPLDLLARVLEGGSQAATAAGCLVAGGHSIDDAEPKYGLAVVGTVDPDRVLTNAGAVVGDVLVLTKPLGIGAITTALKRDLAAPEQVAEAVALMTTSNAGACAAAVEVGIGPPRPVHAGTDVTGFGLLGHLRELTLASGLSAEVDVGAVPALAGALELLASGAVAAGTLRNHRWLEGAVAWGTTPLATQHLLADAQTSGGLLLACAPEAVTDLVRRLEDAGAPAAAVIGRVVAGQAGHTRLV